MVVMLVGIGFLSLLIDGVAERFLSHDLGIDKDVGDEIGDVAEIDVLQEIREITIRLQRLEAAMSRASPAAIDEQT